MKKKKLWLVYVEFGGDMECYECLYILHRLCRGNTKEEVLEAYQEYFDGDISDGTMDGRPINMIEIPEVAEGDWGELKIVKFKH